MNPSRWERVKEIVADAMELDRGQRPAYVERACGGDAELRQDVETLLNADDLQSPILDIDRLPARIGPYRIVREIGRGGMGTVFLGQRDDGQFEQRSAIKVIKRGMDTDAVLRRFFDERRILARLQHPHITRLFDGGTFEGRPYFVMEYIEGEPIVAYSNAHRLSIEARIALFLAVCDAVDHAHRNLILHRDIKASNILVDASGAPKLLDFGIAKLLDEGDTEQSALGQRPLTPQSASPEQVRGEPLTTATDVYALGLLLFELLAGQRAYRVTTGSIEEMARVICQDPPPRPSGMADANAARKLKGDLDNIILKALEKDPARRYQRAADLAADLRRYIQGLPVQARPGGTLYRARKFAARNRRSLAIAAVVLLAIGIAVGDAIRQGQRAQRRFDDLRQLAGSFLFEFHDAIAHLPGATHARELVVKRALQYLDSLSREESNDTGLKRELAESYIRVGDAQGLTYESNLGKPVEALASYRKAVALLSDIAGSKPSDMRAQTELARAQNLLVSALANNGDPSAALRVLQQTALSLESLGRKQNLDAAAKYALGRTYFGLAEFEARSSVDAALKSRFRSIELFRDLATQDPKNGDALRWYATSEKRLAALYLQQLHDPAKAAESLHIAMQIDEQRVAQNRGDAVAKLDLALGQAYMAAVLQRKGDLSGAERLYEASISARKSVLDADQDNYRVRFLLAADYEHLGDVLRDQKRTAEAHTQYGEGLAVASVLEPKAAADADAQKVIASLHEKAADARAR